MAKRLDNIAFVRQLMTDGGGGNPLVQAFILDAIGKAANNAAAMDADAEEASGCWGFVSPYAWQAIGADLQRRLAERAG